MLDAQFHNRTTDDHALAGLFPLPLAPVELFLVGDDDLQYPKTFAVELAFTGSPDRQALEDAVSRTAARHPLLRAHIEKAGKALVWVPAQTARIPVDWLDAGAPLASPRGTWIDLKQECGLRVWVRDDGDRCSIGFQFHHACCDGRGAREWVVDWMTAYAHAIDGRLQRPLRTLNYKRLQQRAVFQPPVARGKVLKTSTWEKLLYGYRFHFQGPRALAAPRDDLVALRSAKRTQGKPASTSSAPHGSTDAIRKHVFSGPEFDQILDRVSACAPQVGATAPQVHANPEPFAAESKQIGANAERRVGDPAANGALEPVLGELPHRGADVTLNDVALALLFQTLADWNRRHENAPGKHRVRILMPTDLREPADVRLPATNRMSFAFLTRTVKECSDWQTLVDGIRRETGFIRTTRLPLDFLAGIAALQGIGPRVLPWVMRWQGCVATAVLTNLGDVARRLRRRFPVADDGRFRAGNLILESVLGAPPIRPQTHAGFGICVCSGRMAVSAVMNTRKLGERGADALFALYIDAWRRWAQLAPGAGLRSEAPLHASRDS